MISLLIQNEGFSLSKRLLQCSRQPPRKTISKTSKKKFPISTYQSRYCKNGAGKITLKCRKIYLQPACILVPTAVYLECLCLQEILPATRGIITCCFAFGRPEGYILFTCKIHEACLQCEYFCMRVAGNFSCLWQVNSTEQVCKLQPQVIYISLRFYSVFQ